MENIEKLSSTKSNILYPLLCVLLTVACAIVWTRGTRIIPHDPFRYLQYTKNYMDSWPTQVGTQWPHGYPFLASFLTEVGLSAYWGMMSVLVISLFLTYFISFKILHQNINVSQVKTIPLVGLSVSPIAFVHLARPQVEWLFSAFVIGTLFLLINWSNKWAIWGTCILVIFSFYVRYAGIFLIPVIGLYWLIRVYEERNFENKVHAFIAIMLSGLVILTLIGLNLYQTGHMSGKSRPPGGGIIESPFHAADLGWSFIGIASPPRSGMQRVAEFLGGFESLLGLTVGWTILGIVLLLCARAFVKSKYSQVLKPAALLVSVYLVCMVAFRSMAGFVDLNAPRFILPILFPLSLITISQFEKGYYKTLLLVSIVIGICGTLVLGRGLSMEVYGNITNSREVLGDRLTPNDTIVVNEKARPLATYYENHFRWRTAWRFEEPSTASEVLRRLDGTDYAVFASRPKGRFKVKGYDPLDNPYRTICSNPEKYKVIEKLFFDETVCVLEIK